MSSHLRVRLCQRNDTLQVPSNSPVNVAMGRRQAPVPPPPVVLGTRVGLTAMPGKPLPETRTVGMPAQTSTISKQLSAPQRHHSRVRSADPVGVPAGDSGWLTTRHLHRSHISGIMKNNMSPTESGENLARSTSRGLEAAGRQAENTGSISDRSDSSGRRKKREILTTVMNDFRKLRGDGEPSTSRALGLSSPGFSRNGSTEAGTNSSKFIQMETRNDTPVVVTGQKWSPVRTSGNLSPKRNEVSSAGTPMNLQLSARQNKISSVTVQRTPPQSNFSPRGWSPVSRSQRQKPDMENAVSPLSSPTAPNLQTNRSGHGSPAGMHVKGLSIASNAVNSQGASPRVNSPSLSVAAKSSTSPRPGEFGLSLTLFDRISNEESRLKESVQTRPEDSQKSARLPSAPDSRLIKTVPESPLVSTTRERPQKLELVKETGTPRVFRGIQIGTARRSPEQESTVVPAAVVAKKVIRHQALLPPTEYRVQDEVQKQGGSPIKGSGSNTQFISTSGMNQRTKATSPPSHRNAVGKENLLKPPPQNVGMASSSHADKWSPGTRLAPEPTRGHRSSRIKSSSPSSNNRSNLTSAVKRLDLARVCRYKPRNAWEHRSCSCPNLKAAGFSIIVPFGVSVLYPESFRPEKSGYQNSSFKQTETWAEDILEFDADDERRYHGRFCHDVGGVCYEFAKNEARKGLPMDVVEKVLRQHPSRPVPMSNEALQNHWENQISSQCRMRARHNSSGSVFSLQGAEVVKKKVSKRQFAHVHFEI